MNTDGQKAANSNERGAIARTYSELEGIHLFEAANRACPLPKASPESLLRSVLQSVEVFLLNVTDLVSRASADLQQGNPSAAVNKAAWACSLGSLLSTLSTLPHSLAGGHGTPASRSVLSIEQSPAYVEHVRVFAQFTNVFLGYVENNRSEIVTAIADFSTDVPLSRLIQLTKIYSHEVGYWKSRLREICISGEIPDYPTFVGSSNISEAVLDRGLKGDTFFMQFRGVHQVPEILTTEINDHLEFAILAIRHEHLRQAYLHLRSVNILLSVVVDSIHPIADNLTPADYHKFRENLGVTSGSHSVNLHYHLFRDLYGQVGTTFLEYLKRSGQQSFAEDDPVQSLRLIDEQILTDYQHFATHLIANELLTLRAGIERWRHSHLHLPRNAVGGGRTKSLTGSPDVIESVKRMRDRAQAADVLQSLAEARFLPGTPTGQTTEHQRDASSRDADPEKLPLDDMLMALTGDVTKARFEDVQKRAGHFSERSLFTAPAKRIV